MDKSGFEWNAWYSYTECSSLTHGMKKQDVQVSVLVVVYPGAPGMVSGFDK